MTSCYELTLPDLLDVLFERGLAPDVLRPGRDPGGDVPDQVAAVYRVADGVDRARWRERFGNDRPHVLPALDFPSHARARELKGELTTRAATSGSPWQDSWWPLLVAGPDHVVCVDHVTGRIWNVDWGSGLVRPVAPTLGAYWAGCAYFLDVWDFEAAVGTWTSLSGQAEGPWDPVRLGMDGPLPVVDVADWQQHSLATALESVLSVHRALDSGVVEALRPPVAPAEVARVESLLGMPLDPQVLEIYSIADGIGPGSREGYGRPRLLPWLRLPPLREAAGACLRSREWTTERFGDDFWRNGWFPVLLAEDRGPGIHVDCAATQGAAWRLNWNPDDTGAPRGGADWRRPVAPSLAAYLLWCGRRLQQMELFVDTDGQVRARDHLDDMFSVDDYGFGPPGTW